MTREERYREAARASLCAGCRAAAEGVAGVALADVLFETRALCRECSAKRAVAASFDVDDGEERYVRGRLCHACETRPATHLGYYSGYPAISRLLEDVAVLERSAAWAGETRRRLGA